MQTNFQRKILRGPNKNASYWAFYCVNDGENVERGNPQVMRCITCYVNLVNNLNPSTEDKKCLITYDKTYGINGLKKHRNANCTII
jgi:hypothetical protein